MNRIAVLILLLLSSCATTVYEDRRSSQVFVELLPLQTEPDFATEQSARELIRDACYTNNFKIKSEGRRWLHEIQTRATWSWVVGGEPKPPKMVYYWTYTCLK